MSKAGLSLSHLVALCCSLFLLVTPSVSSALAEEVSLGNGTTVTINEYLIETDGNGKKTLIVKAVPNFDPEPYGQVPSDDYARMVQPLCGNLVANSKAQLDEEGISAVRVRWDFTPSVRPEDTPENVTITRFHEMVFDIADNAPCIPKPLGVGLDNLAPALSADIKATLRWAEAGKTPGELALTYAVDSGLAALPLAELDRAALELCILHADLLLDARARYYAQLASRTVAITFVEGEEKPGFELLRRVTFPVRDGRCDTGLSDTLTEAIRNG